MHGALDRGDEPRDDNGMMAHFARGGGTGKDMTNRPWKEREHRAALDPFEALPPEI